MLVEVGVDVKVDVGVPVLVMVGVEVKEGVGVTVGVGVYSSPECQRAEKKNRSMLPMVPSPSMSLENGPDRGLSCQSIINRKRSP